MVSTGRKDQNHHHLEHSRQLQGPALRLRSNMLWGVVVGLDAQRTVNAIGHGDSFIGEETYGTSYRRYD